MQRQHLFYIILFVIYNIIVTSHATPIHYDQRQDGKLNVHANLENFVIIIAPISDIPSTTQESQNDLSELSLSGLLEAFEFRQKLLANNKFAHKNKNIIIEAVPEVSENQHANEKENLKESRSLKIKHEKKKATGVTELTLIGEGIENCGPGRFRDHFGVCQFDGSLKN